jgi:hypothetical protein
VALVLRARARPDQLAAPSQPPPQRPRLFVGHPQPVQRAGREQLGERAGVEPVGRRARLPDSRVARMHDQHLADVRLEDPRDLPRVAGHLERHPIACAEALREQLQRRRRGLDPARRTDLARLHDRDLAEVAVDLQPDAPHPLSFLAVDQQGTGGQTTQTDSCSQHTRAGRRGGHRKVGLQAHRAKTGLPSLRSPEKPLSRPNLRQPTDSSPRSDSFMPRNGALSWSHRGACYGRRGCRTKGPGDQHPQRDSHSGRSDWASALQDERVVDEDDLPGLLIRAARDHRQSSPTSGRHTPRLPAKRRRSWTRGGRPNEDSWAMAESDRALQRRKRAIDDLTTEWIAAGTCERAPETAFRCTIGIAPGGFEPPTSRL